MGWTCDFVTARDVKSFVLTFLAVLPWSFFFLGLDDWEILD